MDLTDKRAALLEHVVVASLMGPTRIIHHASLGADKQPLEASPAKRRYVEDPAAASHLGGEMFAHVKHVCACGVPLAGDRDAALAAWARHAAQLTGLPELVLAEHPVLRIFSAGDDPVTVACECGRRFTDPETPYLPNAALQMWLEHVLERASREN